MTSLGHNSVSKALCELQVDFYVEEWFLFPSMHILNIEHRADTYSASWTRKIIVSEYFRFSRETLVKSVKLMFNKV